MALKKMAFLAHWVESWNLLLLRSDHLRKNPGHVVYYCWGLPFCWLVSLLWLISKKPIDIVDEFYFNMGKEQPVLGKTALLRNIGFHFFLPKYRTVIRRRILEAVLLLQKEADVIGLGALAKDERITRGGQLVVDSLGDRLKKPVIHGDTLTAAVVVQQALELYAINDRKTPIFLTGSTSKIGRAVALSLAKKGLQVQMYTKDKERFDAIAEEAGKYKSNLQHATALNKGTACMLWITGKAVPRGKDIAEYMPVGGGCLILPCLIPLAKMI